MLRRFGEALLDPTVIVFLRRDREGAVCVLNNGLSVRLSHGEATELADWLGYELPAQPELTVVPLPNR